MDWIVVVVQGAVALLTLCGVAYGLIALWSARDFERAASVGGGVGFAPGVSILKPVKGVDARMYAGLVSHCVQEYAGEFELLFGVSSLEDEAVREVARLRVEFPAVSIRLVECKERLGASGKMSNLVQMLPEARFEHVIVNDSDIRVSPKYLARVMAGFAEVGAGEKQIPGGNDSKKGNDNGDRDRKNLRRGEVGLVTVPYVGRAEGGLWSKLEALGISTDFMPGVLVARKLEGGIRFGLGSTLATTKTALAAMGGFEAMVDQLADDYELGARLSAAGYKVALVREVVETTVPAYTLRGFCEHQLRWARSTRDSRRWGYVGLGGDICAAVVASGDGGEWVCALVVLAVQHGAAGAGECRADRGRGDSARWAGVAGYCLAAAAGLFWIVLLGVELCGRYDCLAGGEVSVAAGSVGEAGDRG